MSDDTKPVRAGEELDADKLREFLREQLGTDDEISITQFPGGSSNLTYCVALGDTEYVLRRPPFGNRVKTAHNMAREYGVLARLSEVYAPAPRPLIYCADEDIVGSEFFLMERREGLVIRGASPAELAANSELRRAVCESFVANLASLHALDFKAAGLGELGRPEGYVFRQVAGWTKRYSDAKTDEHAELEDAIEWLSRNIPESNGAALIHNDYKFDNLMLDPRDLTRITAVLDWEMATIGEPLMDLGSSLAYWMSPAEGEAMLSMPFNPRALMEDVTRAEIVEMYEKASGRDVENVLFYYVFGVFKLAVIAQQIYFRFANGDTQDKRFASFNRYVGSLGKIALGAIGRGRI